MQNIKGNERSYVIDLISEINVVLNKTDMAMKRAGGELTLKGNESSTRKIMFPDLVLYADENQTEIIQGWELKVPDTPITDEDFIADAISKAETLGLNSTVLWNFNAIVIYVNNGTEWKILKQWNDLNFIETREDVRKYQNEWKSFLANFLEVLNAYFLDGTIESKQMHQITDRVIFYIINQNKNKVSTILENEARRNTLISSYINVWWNTSSQDFFKDEKNLYTAYSKVILLGWILRFIFSNVIKSAHNAAKIIEEVDRTYTPAQVNKIFEEITLKSDFFTIFEKVKYDEILPEDTWHHLIDFNLFLQDKSIEHEVLQNILEVSVARSKRELIGQFTTPVKLARFLSRLSILNLEGDIYDPCAGTGTIPNEVLKYKKEKGISNEISHKTTWASDKLQMVLQIANMSMTSVDTMNVLNKVFQKNVFDVYPDEEIEFRSPENGELIVKQLPKFSAIISNLPFIESNSIDRNEKEIIDQMDKEIFEAYGIKLGKKADYFVFILYAITKLLDKDGQMGIITSNAWLGAEWGEKFYKLLLELFNIKYVVMSGRGRWFRNADVVTTLLILQAKNIEEKNTSMKFVLLNDDINEMADHEIDNMVHSIREDVSSYKYNINTMSTDDIEWYLDKGLSMRALFYKIEWMKNIIEYLSPITDYFDVKRGLRRGWNDMFILDKNHSIEDDYTTPILKTSKSIKNIIAEPDREAFTVSKSLEELKDEKDFGAYNWIKKFETEVNQKGIPLVESLKYKNWKWYEIRPEENIAEFITSNNPDRRLFWAMLAEPSFIDQRLIGISRNISGVNFPKKLFLALLNSILSILFIEMRGFGRGLGALDLNSTNLAKTMILNPNSFTKAQQLEIINLFENARIDVEIDTVQSLEDTRRKEFDLYVLKCIGIEEKYDDIKMLLVRMIQSRSSARIK